MDIFYVGSIIHDVSINEIVENSKKKPSISSIVFEKNLLAGLMENDCAINANSIPPVAMWPNGSYIGWGPRHEIIDDNINVKWLPCINLIGLKQLSLFFTTFVSLIHWLIRSRGKKRAILCYGVFPPTATAVLIASRIFGCKNCTIIADLPEFLYAYNAENKGIKVIMQRMLARLSVWLEKRFQGYVLLTDQMAKKIGVAAKPYIVIEAIARKQDRVDELDLETPNCKAVMYAGTMNKAFGIDKLIHAFLLLKGEYELWLFGSGDYEKDICEVAETDKRIRFFGRVDHTTVLRYEKQATVLINPRSSNSEYTLYSFPSKTIEYMQSGTPMISTRLPGIPKEYEPYLYWIEEETPEGICNTMEYVLNLPDEERNKVADKARLFCEKEKSPYRQTKKIVDLMQLIM